MPRFASPLLAAALVLVAGLEAVAQPGPEIVVMMRDRAGRDSDLDARPLDDAQLELLERVAGVDLEPVRLERNGAQVLSVTGPLGFESLPDLLADLRGLREVLYADAAHAVDASLERRSAVAQRADLVQQVVVKLKDRRSRDRAEANLPMNARSLRSLSRVAGVRLNQERPMSGGAYVLALEHPVSLIEAQAIAARLAADSGVAYADPVRRYEPQLEPIDTDYDLQWHYFEPFGGVNLPPAWDATIGSRGVVIAVLDTGILFDHPDLAGRALPGFDFIWDPVRAGDGTGWDPDATDPGDWTLPNECPGKPGRASSWHGTLVAATVAGAANGVGVVGVNWVSQVLPLRVLGRCGGVDPDIADAIRWAAGLHVPGAPWENIYPARVINMSLGEPNSPCPSIIQNAVTDALAAGSLVVTAAGNDATLASENYPGNCNGTLNVYATFRDGGSTNYSNYGSNIDLAAPGGDERFPYPDALGIQPPYNGILSATGLGDTSLTGFGSKFVRGTSVAAPHVSGVASLLLSKNDELAPGELWDILLDTARPFPILDPGVQCDTSHCGAGILDAEAAVNAVHEPEGLDFYPLTPCRIVDTRGGFGPIPQFYYGIFYGDGLCGVPLGAKAISAIITAVGTTGAGHFRLWPTDRPLPESSSINFQIGAPRANNAFIRLSNAGQFSVYRGGGGGATHFVADVTGYFMKGCPQGIMPDAGTGNVGLLPPLRLKEGERVVYCAQLQAPARRVQVQVNGQCLGANLLLTVTPPTLTFSDGNPMQVIQNDNDPAKATYGNLTKPPGYVPAGTFLVDVLGLEVGGDCQNNGSLFKLSWIYDQ